MTLVKYPGILQLSEDHEYVFDPVAANRPIKFIEQFCKHYEGQFVGEPFLLQPIQKHIIQDIFGWKDKVTGQRRFNSVYWEAAAGAGKSPILAAIGIFGLMFDNEAGAQIFSCAATFKQARIVFDTAKKFIEASPDLEDRLHVTQYEITHANSNSSWRILAGKGQTAGARPHMVMADELHEWKTRETYDSLQARMTKRRQPLFICATNAGESQQSFCWQLHEEAEAVLNNRSTNKTLYPIIWRADKDADLHDPEAWKAANPLLGITVSETKVRLECERARGDPTLEARNRRLYLSQWVQGSQKWLSLPQWDGCTRTFDPAELVKEPLYVALDLSMGDDLCAYTRTWATSEAFYADSHFWLPRQTAEHYELKEGIPYLRWASQGHITLVDEVTISPAVKLRIAQYILETTKGYQLKAVCYDRYKADDCIASLEGAGVTCVPIPQGYSVSPGCEELGRRLKDHSIIIAPNAVLRACAEVVEVKSDDRGNIWPCKPNAKGLYQGRRGAKIDGITALVTGLTEARKASFPASKQKWQGEIIFATRK